MGKALAQFKKSSLVSNQANGLSEPGKLLCAGVWCVRAWLQAARPEQAFSAGGMTDNGEKKFLERRVKGLRYFNGLRPTNICDIKISWADKEKCLRRLCRLQ